MYQYIWYIRMYHVVCIMFKANSFITVTADLKKCTKVYTIITYTIWRNNFKFVSPMNICRTSKVVLCSSSKGLEQYFTSVLDTDTYMYPYTSYMYTPPFWISTISTESLATAMTVHTLLNTHYIPSQCGALVLHSPFAMQMAITSPNSLYPSLQVKLATLP